MIASEMVTFGLVHGVCAGAWCWESLKTHLEEAGHDVVTMDLPCEDPQATFSDYADIVCDAMSSVTGEVVVVGHSTGGMTIPLVAARRPVRELVFLCGLIPAPGKSLIDQGFDWRLSDPAEWQIVHDDGSFSIRPEAFGSHLAQDLDASVVTEAVALLRRQSFTPLLQPCPLETLPDVPCRYVLCREDRVVSPEWSRRAARELLDVEALELPGSHSPMASRPSELAHVLLG